MRRNVRRLNREVGAIAPQPAPQAADAAIGQEKPAEKRGRTRKAANLAGEFPVQICVFVRVCDHPSRNLP
jgi:hypothetical protein